MYARHESREQTKDLGFAPNPSTAATLAHVPPRRLRLVVPRLSREALPYDEVLIVQLLAKETTGFGRLRKESADVAVKELR
eukprot:Skav224743  [mRNA]  locus=scaffold3343:109635:109877:+ [translate_table: standard]